jgi:Na+/melibiose symporter-like transporter
MGISYQCACRGIAVLVLTPKLLPRAIKRKGSVDYLGAVSITSALVLLVYAIVTANDVGWMSMQTIFLMASVSVMVGAFLVIQRRKKEPLIPLNIFKTRNLLASNIVMALLGAAWIPMWFFLNLYIQQILGYGPMESGLALLPMTVMIMVLMISYTPRLVNRFGLKKNMIAGMALLAVAMVLFSVTPSAASSDNSNITIDNENLIYMIYVLPASLVAALGMSLAYIPVLTAAVSNIRKEESGLGSGLVNTSYQIGSALGLAIMVAISSGHTETLQNLGIEQIPALNRGFHLAFIGATIVSIIAAVLIIVSIKKIQQPEKLSSTKH